MSWVLWAKYLVIVGVCGLWLAGWGFRRRNARKRWLLDLHRDETGTGVLEFTLTFFPFLTICLITVQFILIIHAYFFVKYAAYCATRSAIVIIPEYSDGGRNDIGSTKKARIKEAAAWAVCPVSPISMKFWGSIGKSSSGYGSDVLWKVMFPLGLQVSAPYAGGTKVYPFGLWPTKFENAHDQISEVKINRITSGGALTEDPSHVNAFDTIAVDVTYHFYLAMPLGSLISFLDYYGVPPQPCVTLKARCAMMNEGAQEYPTDSP